MKYDKSKIFQQAKEAIEKNNLFFVADIVAWLPCQKSWFYDNFPAGSEEMDTLQGMLEINKTRTKSAIRSKLFKSDKAGELLALYRLICTNEERQMLNQQYIDHTSKNEKIESSQVITTLTHEQLAEYLKK